MFHPSEWKERWYRMDNPGIDVTYDESGSVHRIEAGLLEIDENDASGWSVEQFEQVLGPAPLVGSSREIGKTDRGHLSYPQYRLLIYLEPEGNRFILFEPGF
jgi:hypothetical protein